MADEFMEKMKHLFDTGQYGAAVEAWGADTSNSDEFKRSAFGDYQPGQQDVIVSTYPKSGTTWALQIAYQIGFHGEGEFDHLDHVVPWPDPLGPVECPELNDLSALTTSPTGLHVIKSHLEADYIPYSTEAKYIAVIRDPKDMLVSLIHWENGFNKLLFDDIVPVDVWVETFQTEKFVYQPWPAFTDSWWTLGKRENVLALSYEDMRVDGAKAVERIAEFLGITLTREQFEKVIEKSSFEYMKSNDHKFRANAWESGHIPLVRSGKSGNASELLSPEHLTQIDNYCQRELERLGSDFPYAKRYRAST